MHNYIYKVLGTEMARIWWNSQTAIFTLLPPTCFVCDDSSTISVYSIICADSTHKEHNLLWVCMFFVWIIAGYVIITL